MRDSVRELDKGACVVSTERLRGQVAWISGGASGIGEAIATLFAAEGAKVAIVDIQAERGESVATRIRQAGGEAYFLRCDVAHSEQVRASIEMTTAEFGAVQTIVNCAGTVQVGPLDEVDVAAWDRLMDINLKSIFLAIKYAMPFLRKHARSYVVNVGSVSGFIGQALTPGYIASKHGVIGLTRAIALDYAADGLRCNCICPGITDTPMLRYHLSTLPDPEAALTERLHRVPVGIAMTPLDIARAARYFACEDSSGVTGTTLVVDGGYTATAEWSNSGQTRFME
jgi:NAD(P)-dependent dehydrogenase (short-subunit alcohol dehydrogenase family)